MSLENETGFATADAAQRAVTNSTIRVLTSPLQSIGQIIPDLRGNRVVPKKLRPRAGYPGPHSEGWRWEGSHRQGCCLYLNAYYIVWDLVVKNSGQNKCEISWRDRI